MDYISGKQPTTCKTLCLAPDVRQSEEKELYIDDTMQLSPEFLYL